MVSSPTRIDVGESTSLELTAVDPESDPLAYEWSADCDGTFDDHTLADPLFTLSTLTDDFCTLTVVISDGNGGANQASITVQTGPGIVLPPPVKRTASK